MPPTPSHRYLLQRQGWPAYLAGWTATLLLAALFLHGASRLRWLPKPSPASSIDATLIVHQIDASRAPSDAQLLLIGDSSCMMNVDALLLSSQLQQPVLNLGLLSYLGPQHHARLVREFIDAHPGQVRAVVLLMHPEALRRSGSQPAQAQLFDAYLNQRDWMPQSSWNDRLKNVLGLARWEQRIQNRFLPRLLPGTFGLQYGFNWNLERYLAAHAGSALEPERSAPDELRRGNPTYRLHPAMAEAARAVRSRWPAQIPLIVGITPLPDTFPAPDYASDYRRLLEEWAAALDATHILWDLPPVMASDTFATKTHLTPEGQAAYTQLLAESLKPKL